MAKNLKNLKLEDEVQKDYLDMTTDEKREVCLKSIEIMVSNINLAMGKKYTNPDVFVEILRVTLNQYEAKEEYEACIILRDMINMIDEL